MLLFQLTYRSRPAPDLSQREIVRIADAASRNNRAAGVTGAFVFRDGWFAQTLEGGQHAVCDLYHRIAVDPRHREVVLVEAKVVAERAFPDHWLALPQPDSIPDALCLRFSPVSTFRPDRMAHDALLEFMRAAVDQGTTFLDEQLAA
jgi:hypothetical protein